MINYKLLEEGVFWVTIDGALDLSEVSEYLHNFREIEGLPQDLLLLYDLRNAQLKLSAKHISQISEMGLRSTEKYKTVKTAFVVEECYVATYAYLFAEQVDRTSHERKVFSGEEYALKWLLGDSKSSDAIIKRIIEEKKT